VLEVQRASSSPVVDIHSVLSSSHVQCVEGRPRRPTSRQPFTSIGNLSHNSQQQHRVNAHGVSGTQRTDCTSSPAGVLRRAATVNLHAADTSTPILVSRPAVSLIKCRTPLHGHQLRTCCTTTPTDELTTILQLVVQQIHHQRTKICHIPTS